MPIIPEVLDRLDELTQIRRDIHAHPELGFEEERTAELVANKLAEYGCEVHRGLATTGVVGTLAARQLAARDRAAGRHGLPADAGAERFPAPLAARRQDARLRP